MAIKNLLIAYNGGEASDAALRFAIQMATKYDSHLTGVLAHGVSNISRNIPRWFSGEMREAITDSLAQKAADISARFRENCKDFLATDKVHWIEVGGDPDKTISDYAMMYDFTVVGQFENLVEADELILHPDQIAYTSGRPVFLVPKCYQNTQLDENALLAWDGNRTATRALADAISVLRSKKHVTILTVRSAGVGKPLQDISVSTVLSRHGIPADKKPVNHDKGSVAQAILTACDEVNAGLLVMGAYERSKLGQDLVGGVTNEVVRKTRIPVLMSH